VVILIGLLLDRIVIAPLTRLSRDVNAIAVGGIGGRVSAMGRDELARLGSDINGMLATLEQAEETAHEQDQRLRAVVSSTPIILWAVDSGRKLTLLEGQSLHLLGISAGHGIGRLASETLGDIPQLMEEMNRAFKGEIITSIMPVKDMVFDARYTPVADERGVVTHVIGVATNITERMVAEQALGEAQENIDLQKRQLERARELMRVTANQLADVIHRGAAREELAEYLDFVQMQIQKLA
jgi:signal transduction histidine kinase